MSAITALAAAAGSGICKATIIFLAAATGWWLAAGEHDLARAALLAEQGVSANLRDSTTEQNRAVDDMAKATALAQQRGEAAQAAVVAARKI